MRYCFAQDNDSHWFLIPFEYREDFCEWVKFMEGSSDDFKAKLDYEAYIISCPCHYSLENPEKVEGYLGAEDTKKEQ